MAHNITMSMDITQLANEIDRDGFTELLNEYQHKARDARMLLDSDTLDDNGAALIMRLFKELQDLRRDGWGQ